MFDTVAISQTFARPPDIDLLVRRGCKPVYSQFTGEPYKLTLNGEKDGKEPRITINKSPKGFWILKAEVSIGAWLFDSNIYLPEEKDMDIFFPMLSEYVGDKTGRKFDAGIERVTRADVTRDFQVNESQVLPIIAALGNISLPKYNRQTINGTGIYFENKGKIKNKKYSVYSKFHELLTKRASPNELAAAKGLVRCEIQHKNNRAVTDLAKSLKLRNHNADHVLTRRVSETIIENTMNLLNLASLLDCGNGQSDYLDRLVEVYGRSSTTIKLAGHLALKKKYGADYGKHQLFDLSPKTIKGYDRQCAKAGVSSLE
jgi:hypothetical protein